MKSDKIKKVADELKNHFNFGELHDHPAMIAAEESGSDMLMYTVATALVTTEVAVKNAVNNINLLADKCEGEFDESDIDEIAILAEEFDKSGDELLMKQASVLDQILINFSQRGKKEQEKLAEDKEIERLRAKYRQETREKLYGGVSKAQEKDIHAEEAAKAIKEQVKTFRPLEAPLSTRTCPDHPGAQMMRIGDGVFQCDLDKKIYNYREGFKTMKGNEVPGGDVQEQTRQLSDREIENTSFSTRDSATNNK